MTTRFAVDDLTIHRIVEQETPSSDEAYRPQVFFPDLTDEMLEANRGWLTGNGLDPIYGNVLLCYQTYIVRTPHHTVLIDTCIGNEKNHPTRPHWHGKTDATYMNALAAAGLTVDDIDFVMCTHLHADHVGWNTKLLDGRWVPTFPNARYLFSAKELAYWEEKHAKAPIHYMTDSVLPIVAADRAELVCSDHAIDDHVRLEPTPGHTPDHFRGGRGVRRRPDPFAAAGALSRGLDALGLRPRPGRPHAPRFPGALLRHRHAGLHGALPRTVGRPVHALGRGLPLQAGGVTAG